MEEENDVLKFELASDIEVTNTKNHKKIIIAITICFSIIIVVIITLLIGYFKFNWFKNEIYNIGAKISRNIYQTNYFRETKIINSRVGFTNGISKTNEQKIITNFMVIQTDKKELDNKDFLNNATLVILNSKATFENATKNITSFNIFNESKVEEFKSNPDGAKYPMALFSFYENGTVFDIQLPNNVDNYNAHYIIELIENVVPKLSRNITEDKTNGLNLKTKKDQKMKTIIENQSPLELKEFKGSKFVKSIERDIEEEKLKNIRINSSLLLRNQKDEEQNEFGLKDFQYDTKSEIISTGIKEEKENVGLLQDLAKYYTFIESKELLQLLADKQNQEKEYVIDEYEQDANSKDYQIIKSDIKDISKSFTIKKIEVLGMTITIKVKMGVEGGKGFLQLIISSDAGTYYFGPDGVSYEFTRTHNIKDITILNFKFPPFPALGIALKVSGSLTFSWKVCPNCDITMEYTLSGDLNANVEIVAGWDEVISASAGAQGTIASASLSGLFYNDEKFRKSGSFSGGAVSVYVKGTLLDLTVFEKSWDAWDGWSVDF